MLRKHVVFSFFRYPPGHVFGAFVMMGFQGLFIGKSMPAGIVRLMGCGGSEGFSIVPDLRAYCLMSALDDPREMPALRRTRLYKWVAGPSIEQLHFELEPMSGHGTWDGEALFDYSRDKPGDRPFAVLTHARVNRGHMRDFWHSVPAIRRHLRDAPGCAYHIGFGEHPLRTLATFSIWTDLDHMREFAYRHTPHHEASVSARQEHWLSESMFARFAIRGIRGDVERYPALAALGTAAA